MLLCSVALWILKITSLPKLYNAIGYVKLPNSIIEIFCQTAFHVRASRFILMTNKMFLLLIKNLSIKQLLLAIQKHIIEKTAYHVRASRFILMTNKRFLLLIKNLSIKSLLLAI